MAATKDRPLLVVGVDGSEQAQAALAWAAGHAEKTGGRLRAVIAWDLPMSFGYVPTLPDVDFEADAAATIDHCITLLRKRHPDVPVETAVVHGHAARVLLHQTRGADLLVVGSHGRTAFADALLGSVSQRCIHHATCPVVVVRTAAGEEG